MTRGLRAFFKTEEEIIEYVWRAKLPGTDNKSWSWDDLICYRADKMTEIERNAFEKEMQRDPFLAGAYEGLENVTPDETGEPEKKETFEQSKAASQKMPVMKKNESVKMEPVTEKRDEIVVVGYGTERKRSVTGAVSIVRPDEPANTSKYRTAGPEWTPSIMNGIPTADNVRVRIVFR